MTNQPKKLFLNLGKKTEEKPKLPEPKKLVLNLGNISKKQEASKLTSEKNALRGLGLTKRVMESVQKNAEKQKNLAEKLRVKHGDKTAALKLSLSNRFKEVHERENASLPILKFKKAADEIELDESQIAALNGMLEQRYACLIGAAGTGKTTVMKRFVRMIESTVETINLKRARPKTLENEQKEDEFNVAICFCAFTGRAVQQMKRALPEEYHPMCNTIHATLGYMPEYVVDLKEDGTAKSKLVFRPTFTSSNKLPYKVYIIDEAGMLPVNLWNELWDAIPEGSRVYMIGDINQLPPVQGKSALGFAMVKWPTFELTKIHRQAEGNPIIANAHRILEGRLPEKVPGKFDIVSMPGGSIETQTKTINAIKMLHQAKQFDEFADALIVPQNKGNLGQIEFNQKFVFYFNPEKKENGVVVNKRTMITAGYVHVHFAVGDKVMLLQNDNELKLTNGMIGVVTSIHLNGEYKGKQNGGEDLSFNPSSMTLDLTALADTVMESMDLNESKEEESENQRQASHIMTVEFGDVEVTFSTVGQFKKITHAYAITCHKSQGGEYPTVVILLHSANSKMLSREWLYTAVTRARERVVLLCNDRGLSQALKNQRIKGKTLDEKIKSFIELQDRKDINIPVLPDAKKIG